MTTVQESEFFLAGQLYLQRSSPTRILIGAPVSWSVTGEHVKPEIITPEDGLYGFSPDLRESPYLVPPDATAVVLLIKMKVQTHGQATSPSDAALQIAVCHPDHTPGAVVSFAYASQGSEKTVFSPEEINHNTVPVAIKDGRFKFQYHVYYQGNIYRLERAVFLAGYYAP